MRSAELTDPAIPNLITSTSQPALSSPAVHSLPPTENADFQSITSDPDANPESSSTLDLNNPGESGGGDSEDEEFNPENSFPLAPETQWDAGNGGSGEVESGGAFSLHSQAEIETVNQFYQSALFSQGWTLRYIDANNRGGLTQNWKLDNVYMSVDIGYDQVGLALQVQWHQVELEYVQLLPKVVPLPDQAEFVNATDTTWEVYIPQEFQASAEYYRQQAAALNWMPGTVPGSVGAICSGDCLNQAALTYPPGITPMPTMTPDPRRPQALAYIMNDGNEISLEFHPHQDSTIMNITLTMKNVESAGLPKELPIYPGATDLVIAPGMLRFTVPLDLETTVQYYIEALMDGGWMPNAGYSLDTPELYFQQWDKAEQSLRLNISSPGSSSQSSLVSIQCLLCTSP
jgi:hypothetical protein